MKRDLFESNWLRSRVREDRITRREQVLGYFVGPCLVYMMYTCVAGTYLTQFYTDVLGLAGGLLTLMPLVSKLISGAVSLLLGRLIDRTRTAQGKARPWILGSGLLLTVCGLLLYAVPRAPRPWQIAWVVVSYNLFFSLAFSSYALSHALMVPLSTRDAGQRDGLAMLTSTGTSMLPGMLTTIVMPLLVRQMGVGAGARGAWLGVMGLFSALALPATLVEYYFTLERVTAGNPAAQTSVSFTRQLRTCLADRSWVLVMIFTLLLYLAGAMTTNSMLYYCNWVLGDSIQSGAARQILVNMVGQAPMGIGVVILWPLVRRFGKRRVALVGFLAASLGCGLVALAGDRMVPVLAGLVVKSTGALPTYTMAAFLAEALDHVEAHRGFRVDGLSASVNSLIQSTVQGISQTMLLAGISGLGYLAPASSTQVVQQNPAVRLFFTLCFVGVPAVGYLLCALIMAVYRSD